MPGRVKTKKLSASQLEKLTRFRAMAEQQLVNLGAAIEDARKEKGLSRAKLAQLIPVEAKTIYRWEKGSTGGAMENLRSIATCLDTTPDQLLNAAVAKNRRGPEFGGDLAVALSQAEPASTAELKEMLQMVLDQQASLLAIASEVRSEQERLTPLLEQLERGQARKRSR